MWDHAVNPRIGRWAVVIGISDYQYDSKRDPVKGIPDLRFPDRDAREFARFLMSPHGGAFRPDQTRRNDSREKEVALISAGLKGMAKSFGVCVLALSQLNRKVEARDNKEPELSDLRESGSIEQDADTIMFIYRPEAYNRTEQNRGKAKVIVAKHRNGPTGTVPLTYIRQYTRFENHIRNDA
jgi:hypothetical protein